MIHDETYTSQYNVRGIWLMLVAEIFELFEVFHLRRTVYHEVINSDWVNGIHEINMETTRFKSCQVQSSFNTFHQKFIFEGFMIGSH